MRIVLYALWGAFMVALAVGSAVQLKKASRRKKGLASWPRTQAVVTGYDRRRTGSDTDSRTVYYPRYEYRGLDGQVHGGKSETVGWSEPRQNATLQVAVNPENPAESVPEGPVRIGLIGCASVALGLIGIGMFFFIRMFPLP